MRFKRSLSLLLALAMVTALFLPYSVYAGEQPYEMEPAGQSETADLNLSEELQGHGLEDPEDTDGSDDSDDTDDSDDSDDSDNSEEPGGTTPPNEPEQPENPGGSKADVTIQKPDYNMETYKVNISFEKNLECAYVSLEIVGVIIEEHIEEDWYIYDCSDLPDNDTYTVKITPYDAQGAAGTTRRESFYISYRPAILEDADAEYSLETQVLTITWYGDDIEYVEIYEVDENGEIIYKVDENGETSPLMYYSGPGNLGTGTLSMMPNPPLLAKSKHTYKVVPYNKNDKAGEAKNALAEVDDYVAKIDYSEIYYDDNAKQLRMIWENGTYTENVTIYLNDVILVEGYKETFFTLNCNLQPGATYIVTIEPYNDQEEIGEEEVEDVSYGTFDAPDDMTVSLKSVEAKDSKGLYTGFSKPAVYVKWSAQKGAVYDIYRATSNKKSAYNWLASVKADQDGRYTYIDEKLKMGTYYYKICRRINKDPYIEQAIFSALSDEDYVKVAVPKPALKAKLDAKGRAALTLASGKDFVSGYDIYRKCGDEPFQQIASINENEYIDKNVEFGKTYQYKAKAFYYDTASGVRSESAYSAVSKVKNEVGKMEAEAVAVSQKAILLSWTPAANASEYEIYHKSGAKGADYKLWKTTGRLSVKYEAGKGGTHMFLIKAKQVLEDGREYSSSAKASCIIGFSAPEGFQVVKTSYSFSKKSNTLTQKITLSWNRVYGAKGYYVELRDEATKKYKRVATVKGSSKTSYNVSKAVTAGAKALRYRISAYKGKTVKKGKTLKVDLKIGTAKKVKAVKSGSQVKISWNKVTGADCYQVYRSNGRTMHLIGKTKNSSIKDKGLSAEINYQYYVRAVNQTLKLQGPDSEPAKFCMANRAKVANLTAENMRAGIIDLEWNDLIDAKSYIIYFKTSPEESYQKLAEVSGKKTSFAHKGQPVGMTCYYKVTAIQANSKGVLLESKAALANVTVAK